jgi:uncharacterized protein (DUF2141 family)
MATNCLSKTHTSILKSGWLAGLVVLLGTVAAAEPSQPGIHVDVLGIRNSIGAVACALFESPEGFPKEFLRFASNLMVVKVRATKATCNFEDITPGTYAIAVIHDENRDGKLATDWVGVPEEGYAFSKDAKGTLGPPSFEAASFSYNGQSLNMTITLEY